MEEVTTPNMPNNPFSKTAPPAIELHEMFQSFLDAGFTRKEAFQLFVMFIGFGFAANSL